MVADVLAVIGLILLASGLALLSVPLALVVVGALLLASGIASHFTGEPDDPGPPLPPQP